MPWLVIRYRIKRFSLLGNENLYLQQLEMHGWRYYILALFISIFPITTAHGCRQRWISWSEHNRLPAAVLPATFTVRKWFFLHKKLHLRLPGQEETFRPNTKNLSWSSLELSFESMEEISFFSMTSTWIAGEIWALSLYSCFFQYQNGWCCIKVYRRP